MRQARLSRRQREQLRYDSGALLARTLLARLEDRAALDPEKVKPRRRSWVANFLQAGALTKVGTA